MAGDGTLDDAYGGQSDDRSSSQRHMVHLQGRSRLDSTVFDERYNEDHEDDSLEANEVSAVQPTSAYEGERAPRLESWECALPDAMRSLTYNTYIGTSRDRSWIGIPPLYHHEDPYYRPHLRLATRARSPNRDTPGLDPHFETYDGKWPSSPIAHLQSDYGSDSDEEGSVSESDPAWKQMPAHLLPFVPYIEKPTDATSESTLRGRRKSMHIDTIQAWLKACETQHGSQCYSHDNSGVHSVRPQYLIDVERLCLVETPETGKYVALSYSWGSKSDPAACTTSSNLESLMEAGGLRSDTVAIPRTVLDAMQLVERLGERYLWCDRYCIVQDDNEAKYKQLATMGKIYARAFFTLVAAQNNDATEGLYGRRKMVLGTIATVKQKNFPGSQQSNITGDQIMLDQAIGLMRTKWFSRGWTFQENHFSRRKVVFQDDTVNFECCNASWHEAQDISKVLARNNFDSKEDPSKSLTSASHRSDYQSWPDMIRYARLVSLFNERDLTFPEDTFDAFAGILQHLSTAFSGGFISGLPVLYFDAALLWQPWTPITRRRSKKPDHDAALPSWSWGGWTGILQSEAWRSASNYQYIKDASQQCSWRTFSTVQWHYSQTVTSERYPIEVPQQTAQPNLKTPSAVDLPEGWSCSAASNNSGTLLFYHTSDPLHPFRYPIPICDPRSPPQPVVNARFLHCTTNRGYLRLGKTISRWASNCPAINLKTTFGWWAGVLRLPCKDHEVEDSVRKHKGRAELIEISAGSVENQNIEERSFDEWNVPVCPRYQGVYEFVNVLWIEWVDGVAYRKALGRVKKSTWGRLRKERIDITLG